MPNTGPKGKSNIKPTNCGSFLWRKESLMKKLSLSIITDDLILCWQNLENADLI